MLEACIFPDDSTIDLWRLFYRSDNIIRGIDLARYCGIRIRIPERSSVGRPAFGKNESRYFWQRLRFLMAKLLRFVDGTAEASFTS